MRLIKILFITLFCLILIIILVFFLTKHLILAKIESTIIEKIERSINRKIDVGGISYIPYKGIALKDIHIYEKNKLPAEGISIDTLYAKMSLPRFVSSRQIHAVFRVEDIGKNKISGDAIFTIASNQFKSFLRPFKDFSLNNVDITRLSFSSPVLDLKNISGTVYFKENEISAPEITFYHMERPNKLSFYIRDLKTKPSVDVKIEGEHLKSDVHLTRQDTDLIKIDKVKLEFYDSSFEGDGEIQNLRDPVLLMYGSLNLNTMDLCNISAKSKETCSYLRIDGRLNNEFYFKGRINDALTWELATKTNSRMIKILDYRFSNLSFEFVLKNGLAKIPLLTAYPYNGILRLSSSIDFSKDAIPYSIALKLEDIDINALAQDSELRNRNIYGRLDAELLLQGYNAKTHSITGKGNIFISEGNLGPMPLLSPLLGHVYGVIRGVMPGLRKVDITGGACDFFIEDRRIITNNLLLWGEALNIKARGHIDFDTNLNFEVENEFKEVSEDTKEDWQKSLLDIIASVGKFIGKAYLTGTLSKPKWKFEYFSNFQDALGGKLKDVIRGIFE